MSTYTLAIMVSKYGYTEAFSKGGIKFLTWFFKENLKWARRVTEHEVIIMEYLQEKVFKEVKYPLKKMNQIVVPNKSGAMENWGIMTFGYSILTKLKTSEIMGDQSTYFVDTFLVHELVHQWHGNLVTCAWWNEFWLNEGMTSYFESIGMLAFYPQ